MRCVKFRKKKNIAMATTAETAKSPLFSIVDILQHADLRAQNEPKTLPIATGCLSVNFTICPVCQKLGVYDQHLPIPAAQYDNSSKGKCQPDEVPLAVAPCEECLKRVTISNMSIDSKPVETDGKRGRYRKLTVDSDAREPVVNPDEWPHVDLKPSKSSEIGQRYVGPGGEKFNKLGESTVKVRTDQHNGSLKSSDIPRSQSPQALACTVG